MTLYLLFAAASNTLLASKRQFAEWYSNTYQDVFRYIYAMQGGPPQVVEDITAETFLKAWQKRDQFHGSTQDATRWVFAIARNLLIDHWRQMGRYETDVDIETLNLPDHNANNPENKMLLTEKQLEIRALLQTFPIRQREVLVLRLMLDWRVKEISQFLDISENAVSTSLRRARQRFEEEWKEEAIP